MEFLGKLGIDVKLLVAQLINFGLLLWLLAKLVYKPIIKRIEKNESELKEAQEKTQALEQEKEAFEEKKAKETIDTKQRATAIIHEAERLVESMEEKSHQKIDKETKALLTRARTALQSQRSFLQKEIFSDITLNLEEKLQISFKRNMQPVMLKELQEKVFFAELMRQLKTLSLGKMRETDFAEVFEELKSETESRPIKRKEYGRELQKILAQRIGPIVLDYAFVPTDGQKKEIQKVVAEKIGIVLDDAFVPAEQKKEIQKVVAEKVGIASDITEKQNAKLISGFRFEIAGNLIESNLAKLLSDNLEDAIGSKK